MFFSSLKKITGNLTGTFKQGTHVSCLGMVFWAGQNPAVLSGCQKENSQIAPEMDQ